MMKRLYLMVSGFVLVCLSVPVHAQAPRADGRLIITVADPSGAIIPSAAVTVLDQANPATAVRSAVTSDKGTAIVEGLVPGRYTIHAEFGGFQPGLLKDVRVRSGDNKHVVILAIENVRESLTVSQDAQIAASDPRSLSFVTILTPDQIDALSDDPTELAQQIQDLANANAIIRVDSFVGGQLPPKAQIKSIHIVRDAFAAENHSAEADEIDIITEPGVGPIRGGVTSRFRDGSMSGRSPFTPIKGPERTQNFEGNLGGSLVKDKSSFSVSVGSRKSYDSPTLNAALPDGTRAEALNLRRPNDNVSVRGLFDYALTRDQTLRLSYYQSHTSRKNLGVGAYDLTERAYATDTQDHEFHAQVVGPLARRVFANTRLQVQWTNTASQAAVEAPTIRVIDAFTLGGAQVAGGRHPRDAEFASDIDYVRGQHSVRGGVIIDGGRYRTDDSSNYLGTYTFTSLAAYMAGQPATYTRRVGNPLLQYWNMQAAAYVQDDIRVRKGLTLSPGIRYEAQTHLHDPGNVGPRVGISWAPFKSGKTTLRASAGIFYNWLAAGTYEQTLRVDGFRQQELNIVNPGYPDTGLNGIVSATNRYGLGDDVQMGRTARFSAGIEQTVTPNVRVNATYSKTSGSDLLRGANLNAPADGVRPNPAFANIVEVVSDARSRTQQLATTINVSLSAPSRGANQPLWNWRRTTMRLTYWLAKADNNTDGAFNVPASGSLLTEWGPVANDRRHRFAGSVNSQFLRNFSANVNLASNSGTPYTITTGVDNNGDSIFNDRPSGVGRNSLRTPWQYTWSSNFSYSIDLGARPAVAPGRNANTALTGRYRLSFTVAITNLANRANFSGFSGVMTSPFFEKATAVTNPRKIDIGMNVRF